MIRFRLTLCSVSGLCCPRRSCCVVGKNITLCGGAGSGQHTKMCNQILISSTMIGVVEGLLYAQKAGLDPLTVISAVQAGAAGSWTITNLGPKIVARDFRPGFYVRSTHTRGAAHSTAHVAIRC